jgi:uncharacterized protein (TIGR03546 family)
MPEFFIKPIFCLKQVILGRREPHQLAWALALGVLLGIVPHGNLLAMAILLFILSVRVNHLMVAATAVATGLIAVKLDAQTHVAGKYLLTHPDLSYHLSAAWQWPLVAWTDLNNTVVMGSLVFGLTALLPTYLFSYPVFHAFASSANDLPSEHADPPPHSGAVSAVSHRNTRALRQIHLQDEPSPTFHPLAETDATAIDAAFRDVASAEQAARQVTVDTRIEVIRISAAADAKSEAIGDPLSLAQLENAASETSQPDQPMSEALNYLLRQLRDARRGRAA